MAAALALPLPIGAVPPASAQSGVTREVRVQNSCRKPVRVLIHHAATNRNWVTRGWYELAGNDQPRLIRANNQAIQQLSDHNIFYFAEARDGSVNWGGEGTTATFGGVRYQMRRATPTIVNGDFLIRLTCN